MKHKYLAPLLVFFNLVCCSNSIERVWDITESFNVQQNDCKDTNGLYICCVSLNYTTSLSRKKHFRHENCQLTKVYIPSEYEQLHKQMAIEVNDDIDKFRNFIHSKEEIIKSLAWLKRVKLRMSSVRELTETDDDHKYLSRFIIQKNCSGKVVLTWNEWIEPIIMQLRHPFAYLHPVPSPGFRAGLLDTDYVLFTSSYYNSNSNQKNSIQDDAKYILIDAGASQAFPISSQFFVCAYAQRGIFLNNIYSYEYVNQNNEKWMNTVPFHLKNKVKFLNFPISENLQSEHNPLNLIKKIAKQNDFVSFKLDIDNGSIEIPLLYQLLNDPIVINLIDEFIFELHYNCPVMKEWWGAPLLVPSGYENKIILNRVEVMKYFTQLREHGIRSHFWV